MRSEARRLVRSLPGASRGKIEADSGDVQGAELSGLSVWWGMEEKSLDGSLFLHWGTRQRLHHSPIKGNRAGDRERR